jgi:nicotinamide N-methyltransferase
VEIIASTLQPASTINSFTFTLPAPNTPLAPSASGDLLRASVLSNADHRSSAATFNYPYSDDPFQNRPTSGFLGPPSLMGHSQSGAHVGPTNSSGGQAGAINNTVTYHGVCLTVWSHADAERSNAIRRTLEAGRSRKESSQSAVASRIKNLRADVTGADPRAQARRTAKKSSRGPWATDGETDADTEGDGMSESEVSTIGHGPGESTLFLPGDTVFWLPYALSESKSSLNTFPPSYSAFSSSGFPTPYL